MMRTVVPYGDLSIPLEKALVSLQICYTPPLSMCLHEKLLENRDVHYREGGRPRRR